MDKLKLAHDYAKKFTEKINDPHKVKTKESMRIIAENAWNLADAMQAEADSRVNKERPDVLNPSNSMELEWQPDWSQAPVKTVAWRKTEFNECEWLLELKGKLYYNGKAPTFGYIGNWQDSLRKRP